MLSLSLTLSLTHTHFFGCCSSAQIIAHRTVKGGGVQYLVQWKEASGEDSWEPASSFPVDEYDLVAEYWRRRGEEPPVAACTPEAVEARRTVKGGALQVLVRWTGREEATWEAPSRALRVCIARFDKASAQEGTESAQRKAEREAAARRATAERAAARQAAEEAAEAEIEEKRRAAEEKVLSERAVPAKAFAEAQRAGIGGLPAQSQCRINGLQAAPELNGKTGIVQSYDKEKGRYTIIVETATGSSRTVALRPANLQCMPPEKVAKAEAEAKTVEAEETAKAEEAEEAVAVKEAVEAKQKEEERKARLAAKEAKVVEEAAAEAAAKSAAAAEHQLPAPAAPSIAAPAPASSTSSSSAYYSTQHSATGWIARLPAQWRLGVILGPTACGKSRAIDELRAAGLVLPQAPAEDWPADQSIISVIASTPGVKEEAAKLKAASATAGGIGAFLTTASATGSSSATATSTSTATAVAEKCNDLAMARLGCVGLNSLPTWLRPHAALSNGQRARAHVARALTSGLALDDFGSTVDARNASVCASEMLTKLVMA